MEFAIGHSAWKIMEFDLSIVNNAQWEKYPNNIFNRIYYEGSFSISKEIGILSFSLDPMLVYDNDWYFVVSPKFSLAYQQSILELSNELEAFYNFGNSEGWNVNTSDLMLSFFESDIILKAWINNEIEFNFDEYSNKLNIGPLLEYKNIGFSVSYTGYYHPWQNGFQILWGFNY